MTSTSLPPMRGTVLACTPSNSCGYAPRPAVVALDGLWVLNTRRYSTRLLPADARRTRGKTTSAGVVLLHANIEDRPPETPAALAQMIDTLRALAEQFTPDLIDTNTTYRLTPGAVRNALIYSRDPGWEWFPGIGGSVLVELIDPDSGLQPWEDAQAAWEVRLAEAKARRDAEDTRRAATQKVVARANTWAAKRNLSGASAVLTGDRLILPVNLVTALLDATDKPDTRRSR